MRSVALALLLLVLGISLASGSGPGLGCGYDWQRRVCRESAIQLTFSDGCNQVTCDGNGDYTSTLMECPEAATDAEKLQCDNIRKEVQARADAGFEVACSALAVDAVCATAVADFTYSDGCNTVTCDGRGGGLTTLKSCPGPARPVEIAGCDRRLRDVVKRLEPRTCRGINATDICLAREFGFRFTDGCNWIECGRGGTWTSTLMACPTAETRSAICRWALRQAMPNREFPCPMLAMRDVCTAGIVGFRYNDGCNEVQCTAPGRGISTFRLCQPARPGESEAQVAYCLSAEAAMLDRRSRSAMRYQCLTAADVCKASDERKSFFDGCNYCFCMGPARAGCTRRACRPFFSTKEEFDEECRRRKAGVIN